MTVGCHLMALEQVRSDCCPQIMSAADRSRVAVTFQRPLCRLEVPQMAQTFLGFVGKRSWGLQVK